MNQVILIGRLTRDPELRYIESTGNAVCRFSLAVDRPFAKKDAEVTADFFNITVWGRRAETCANYLSKGLLTAVRGRIQNNSYIDKNGNKQYTVDIIAEDVQFLEWGDSKKKSQSSYGSNQGYGNSQYQGQSNFAPQQNNFAQQQNNFRPAQNQQDNEFMPENSGLDEDGYRSLADDTDLPF